MSNINKFTTIQISYGVRDKLKKIAKKNVRSMAGQVEAWVIDNE